MSPSHRLSTPFKRAGSDISSLVNSSVHMGRSEDRRGRHRGHTSGESRHGQPRSRHPREIIEALPSQYNLTRPRVERVDIRDELDKCQHEEDRRHGKSLVTVPLGNVERKCPYGAPLAQSQSGLMLRRRADRAALLRSQSAAAKAKEEDEPKPKKRPGILLVEIPYDPTDLPNEHEARGAVLDGQIAAQEAFLSRSRSEAVLRLQQGFEVKPEEFNYDHLPPGTDVSEAQSQFFPRSRKIVKEIGCGKDPRFCRPWEDYEKHREMLFKQKAAMSGKK